MKTNLLLMISKMTPMQRQFFTLGFKEGYKAGLQEASESEKPKGSKSEN